MYNKNFQVNFCLLHRAVWSVDTNVSEGHTASVFMNGLKKMFDVLTLHLYIQIPHDRP